MQSMAHDGVRMSAASSPAASASSWMAFVVGALPGAALASAAALGVLDEDVAFWLFVPSFVGLNAAHMAATWSRTYLTRGFALERPIERLVVPFALAAFALAYEAVGGAVVLFGVQYYLSVHHAAMQNYGLVRTAHRASGRAVVPLSARIDQAACLLPLMAALTHRARAVSAVYDGAALVVPPAWLVVVLASAAVCAVIALVVRETIASLRGERVDVLSLGVSLGVTATWCALMTMLESATLPFFALASGHYVQYLWYAPRAQRADERALHAMPLRWRAHVHPSRGVAHVAFLLVFGLAGIAAMTMVALGVRAAATTLGIRPETAMALPPWGAAMLAVNLHHYWLDHRIWRSPPSRST